MGPQNHTYILSVLDHLRVTEDTLYRVKPICLSFFDTFEVKLKYFVILHFKDLIFPQCKQFYIKLL